MISYIKGELIEILEDVIIVETGNIGYNIRVPLSLLDELPKIGEEVKIYTFFHVREDAMSLFGFLSRNDLSVFRLLLGVNGVGPKGALGVLSAIPPDDLRLAVITDNAKAISKAPGVGAKTAQRIILDLKDKIKIEEVFGQSQDVVGKAVVGIQRGAQKEAIEALIALGYSGLEASKAVRQVEAGSDMDVEDILKASLKKLAF